MYTTWSVKDHKKAVNLVLNKMIRAYTTGEEPESYYDIYDKVEASFHYGKKETSDEVVDRIENKIAKLIALVEKDAMKRVKKAKYKI